MPSDSASDQLQRILYILPAAARGEPVSIEDIAAVLDVDAATVMHDIEHVAARAFYHPAGSVEAFSVLLDGSTVQVHAPHEFQRPVRLNQRETLALGLGLRSLASDAEPGRRREIMELAHRLEALLASPDVVRQTRAPSAVHGDAAGDLPIALRRAADSFGAQPAPLDDVDYEDVALAFDDDGFRGVVADAVEQRRVCTIWYLKPGDVAPAYRSIAPCRLLYAEGMWYVAAYDLDREALRFFRLDRVLDARLEDEPAPPWREADIDALVARGPYVASDDVEVRVRYSARVARWVAERTQSPLHEDGSLVLHHRVADARWIVRHVLQYGGEAVVEEPAAARQWVATAAADVANGTAGV